MVKHSNQKHNLIGVMDYELLISGIWYNLIMSIFSITPDPLFLLMAAGFLGVIIAFLIPTSIEITSKVAIKYNSEVVVRLFQSNPISKYFPYFVLLNIAAMLTMRFISTADWFQLPQVQVVLWGTLLSSIIITIITGYLVLRLERIISDDRMPLRMLLSQIDRELKARFTLRRKDSIIQYIEGIGDMLVYQIQKNNSRAAMETLTELGKMSLRMTRFSTSNNDKLVQLVYSTEIQNYQGEKLIEVCLRHPNRHLGVLSASMNQLERSYINALDNNEEEVAALALRSMRRSLYQASTQDDNELIVEFIISRIHNSVNSSIRSGKNIPDDAISWYLEVLFTNPQRGAGSLNLKYLDIYDTYFIGIIENILSQGRFGIFRTSISYMAESFGSSSYGKEKLWGYYYLLRSANFDTYLRVNREHRLQRNIRRLVSTESQIYTLAGLNKWLDDFSHVKTIVEDNIKGTDDVRKARDLVETNANNRVRANIIKARDLENEIVDNAIKHLKYSRLTILSHVIGSLCLLNDKIDYLKFMRETAQELDNDKEGINLIPQNLQEIMNDYLIFHDITERHNLSANAYRRHILLLLDDAIDDDQTSFTLPFVSSEQINLSLIALRELADLAESDMQDNKGQDMFGAGLSSVSTSRRRVVAFLKKQIKEIDKILIQEQGKTTISKKIEDTFQSSLIDAFKQRLVFRDIYNKYLNLYQSKMSEKFDELPNPPWGINEIILKSSLTSSGLQRISTQYGENLADIENLSLFQSIMKNCTHKKSINFEDFINNLKGPEDLIIIASYSGVENFLNHHDQFHRLEYLGTATNKADQDIRKVNGFVGYYEVEQNPIPVFNFYYRGSGEYLLVLHKSKMGKLEQIPLIDTEVANDKTSSKYKKTNKEAMYFQIQDLAKENAQLKRYIDDPPSWLTKVGDVKEQREFLKQRAAVTVLENLRITEQGEKMGYVIDISDNNLSSGGRALLN